MVTIIYVSSVPVFHLQWVSLILELGSYSLYHPVLSQECYQELSNIAKLRAEHNIPDVT